MSKFSHALASLGLSATEIAQRSKLPLNRVEELLNGASCNLAELRALSTSLRVPKSYFASERSASLSSISSKLLFRDTTRGKSNYDYSVSKISSFIETALQILPERSQESAFDFYNHDLKTYEDAVQLANEFRLRFFGADMSSPLNELPDILGSVPEIVLSIIRESRFEGISIRQGGYYFIFISPRFAARMLFTLAHELGHVIAHHVTDDTPLFEGASTIGSFKKANLRERFVDAFASSLLLPKDGVIHFLTFIRDQRNIPLNASLGDIEILLLARFFGVSFDVAAHRCEALSLLPMGGGVSLSERLKKDFGSPEKRAEAAKLPPRVEVSFPIISYNLQSAIVAAIDSGDYSIGWLAEKFDVSISDIHSINSQKFSS